MYKADVCQMCVSAQKPGSRWCLLLCLKMSRLAASVATTSRATVRLPMRLRAVPAEMARLSTVPALVGRCSRGPWLQVLTALPATSNLGESLPLHSVQLARRAGGIVHHFALGCAQWGSVLTARRSSRRRRRTACGSFAIIRRLSLGAGAPNRVARVDCSGSHSAEVHRRSTS